MIINEKLKLQKESPHILHLFKEGAFWVVYEQSAYAVWLLKKYKATRKFVKAAKQEVVSLGFPDVAVKELQTLMKKGFISRSDVHISVEMEQPTDEAAFLEWKSGIVPAVASVGSSNQCFVLSAGGNVEEEIRRFDLLNSTPMECAVFLSELKKELKNEK